MTTSRIIAEKRLTLLTILLLAVYGSTGWYYLHEFFGKHPVLFTGLLLMPYVLVVREPGRYSGVYGFLSLLLLGLTLWMPVKTLYFLALGFATIFWIESRVGRVNHLPLFFLGVLSPVFNFITTIFGFPIRLRLSEWAGVILQKGGLKMVVSGNILSVNGTDFSVDPACMGLNMLVVSLIIGLLMLAFQERKRKQVLPMHRIALVLLATFGLNLLCNLIRIVLLVWFRLLPDNPLHDAVGMGCLLVYVVLPLWYLTPLAFIQPFFFPDFNHRFQFSIAGIFGRKLAGMGWIHVVLLVLALVRGWTWEGRGGASSLAEPGPVAGYQREVVEAGIYKYSKQDALLYVKPVVEFFDAEHTPLICWQGSGYEFKKIGQQKCGDLDIYTGILQKGDDLIYTAWWFDNGQHKTISQADWRWRMGRGEAGFSLINLNADREEALMKEIVSLLKVPIF
jgi:exosortase N